MKTIFVRMASYRDPECKFTIRDLFRQAEFPERVFVGLTWQYADTDLDLPCFDEDYRPRVRVLPFDHRHSRGCCWARGMAESMYQGEDFLLSIDAHMRFPAAWDSMAITLHDALIRRGHPKPVLTYYPPAYIPPDQRHERIPRMVPRPLVVAGQERGIFTYARAAALEPTPSTPYLQASVAAGFLFAGGGVVHEVPYDPHLYFFGEEITLAARLWTRGYDFFHPGAILAYHLYKRTLVNNGSVLPVRDIATHGGDHEDSTTRNQRSYARVRHLLGAEESPDPEVTQELSRYGLGEERSLYQFARFAGLDLRGMRQSPFAILSLYHPAQIPAGRTQEETALTAGESARDQTRPAHTTILSFLAGQDRLRVLDLGATGGAEAMAQLCALPSVRSYLALTICPGRAQRLREMLAGQGIFYAAALNYAAERLPPSDLVLTGNLLPRLPTPLVWQILEAVYHSGSRFLVVQGHDCDRLMATPFFLPPPSWRQGSGQGESAVWDLDRLPPLCHALPSHDSRLRRIILDSLAEAVRRVEEALPDAPETFHALLAASLDCPKAEAKALFTDPTLIARLEKADPEAGRALARWWALRRRNFPVARAMLHHPLLLADDTINPWWMQAMAWNYFTYLAGSPLVRQARP